MKRTVWKFGLLTGLVLGGVAAVTLPLCFKDRTDFEHAEVIGYTVMVLSFLLVFFGVRSYRENVGGGAVTFGKALQVAILIVLVASVMYALAWQVVYFGFIPDFGEKYGAHVVAKMKAKGESAQAVEKATQDMKKFAEMYKNPFFNFGVTLLEVFPVGLVVALVSAGILRRRNPPVRAA